MHFINDGQIDSRIGDRRPIATRNRKMGAGSDGMARSTKFSPNAIFDRAGCAHALLAASRSPHFRF